MPLSVKLVFEATGAVADGRSGAAGGRGCYSVREHKNSVTTDPDQLSGPEQRATYSVRVAAADRSKSRIYVPTVASASQC